MYVLCILCIIWMVEWMNSAQSEGRDSVRLWRSTGSSTRLGSRWSCPRGQHSTIFIYVLQNRRIQHTYAVTGHGAQGGMNQCIADSYIMCRFDVVHENANHSHMGHSSQDLCTLTRHTPSSVRLSNWMKHHRPNAATEETQRHTG